MADDTLNPFANAIVGGVPTDDDDENQSNPFAGAIIGDAPPGSSGTPEPTDPINENPFEYLDQNVDLIGTAVDLPNPTTTMYDDIEAEGFLGMGGRDDAFEKALKRYQFYAQHPDSTRTTFGALVYNNRIVPYPEQSFFTGDMDVSLSQKISLGLRNAGVNILETGEILTDLTGLTDPNTTYIADNFAKADTGDSTVDSLIVEGTGLVAGGLGAGKLAQTGIRLLPKIGQTGFAQTIATALGFELGVASTAESDAGTLLVGNNAVLADFGLQPAIAEGMTVDPEDPVAQQELAKRMNILMDGMTAAGLFEGVVKGGDFVARTIYNIFVDPFARAGSISRQETDFVRELVDQLIDVGDDPASINAARERVAQLIEENKNLYVDLPPELADNVNITVDTMTALERALRENDTEAARSIIQTARSARQGVIQQPQGTNITAQVVARPTNELDRVTAQAQENLGGQGAIDTANQQLQEQGLREIDQANLGVLQAEENLANLNQRIVQELREDPSIIGRVTELETKYGFDIGSLREKSADEIVLAIGRASEAMDKTKNDLFNAIEGGEIDTVALIDTLRALRPQQLDVASSAMPGDNLFGTMLEQTRLRQITDEAGNVTTETVEQMQERFANWANSNGLDFAKLFTEIRPSLVDSINRLERGSAAEQGAAQVLIRFKSYIDNDAMDFLEESANDETLEAAQEAMRYFREEWAPFWDDASTLQEIGALRRQTTARGKQTPMFEDTSRQMVTNTISDQNRSVAGNMIELLNRPEAAADPNLVTDFIIGDVLSTISSRLDSVDNIANLGLNDMRQSLGRYSTLIRERFPEQAARLDELAAKLNNNQLTKEQLQMEVVQAQRLAKEAEERIFQQELNGFFTANGIPRPNGYATLANIFDNKQAIDQLTGLMARAEGNPIIEQGIQAGYTRWFRNKFLGSTESAAGDRVIKQGNLTLTEEDIIPVFDYANVVFRNKPEFVAALDTLLTEAGLVQRSRGSKAIPTGSGTAELTERIAAINRGITATLGVLSRIGARIRATTVGYVQKKYNANAYYNMVDNLMANPDEFIRVVGEVVREDRAVGTIPIRLPFTRGMKIPESVPFLGGNEAVFYLDRGALYKMMTRAGIYREGNEEDERSFAEILAQTELDFTRARDEFIQSQELGLSNE